MNTLSDVLGMPQEAIDRYVGKESIMKANATVLSKLRKKPNGGDILTLDIPASFAEERGWNKGEELEIGPSEAGAFIRKGIGKCDLCGERASVRMGGNKLCQPCIDKIAALKKQ